VADAYKSAAETIRLGEDLRGSRSQPSKSAIFKQRMTTSRLQADARALLRALPVAAFISGARLARWESTADDLTVADGEAGRGVYFFYAGDPSGMSEHYARRSGDGRRRRVDVMLAPGELLVDLTHRNAVSAICRWLTRYSAACGSSCKWTSSSFQRSFWGLTALAEAMREVFPEAVGYAVPHVIPSCRPSKQIVVYSDDAVRFAAAA
jgi:hypothetical protein